MTNQEVVEEIRLNRAEIASIKEDFALFKGKAYGFIALLTVLTNVGINLFTKKG